MWEAADRVKETTTTTGTGDITLAGAVSQFRAFSAQFADQDRLFYAVVGQSGTEWEVGYGTYQSSGTVLKRTKVLRSSNSDNAVNFSAGTKDVMCVHAAILGIAPAVRKVVAGDGMIVPPDSSVVVSSELKVNSGKKVRVELGGVLEIT